MMLCGDIMSDKNTNEKNLHIDHRKRMRERYRDHGLENFHDHEVLEMLLYYCYPRCDTNKIAHKMINEFQSLPNLFDADIETLMARLGCTEKIAMLINLMPAIAKRYLNKKWGKKVTISDSQIAGEYAISLFVGEQVESFYVLCLNSQLQLNQAVLIAKGTIDEVPIFTRELVRAALQYQSANVILAHNHPGGVMVPSHEDNVVTTRVKEALALIDVAVIDHIIVAGDKYFSYAQRYHRHVVGY